MKIPSAKLTTFSAVSIALLGSCTSCAIPAIGELFGARGGITVMSYNLQTLFDPVDQGGEYEEFRVEGGSWGDEAYGLRLAALASSIRSAPDTGEARGGPDIVVVQEAENGRVLRDLAEAAGPYPYVVSSPDEDAILSCGILSRWPPLSAKAHRARPEDGSSSPRFILEVDLDVDGRRLAVIAVHLKSKLGGAAETEAERMAAASLISDIVSARLSADPSLALIVAGDFNENPDEHDRVGGSYRTALMPAGSGDGPWLAIADSPEAASADPLALYCPWEEGGGYSYRYEGEEERIDQLLMSPALARGSGCAFKFEGFSAEPPEFAVDSAGNPLRWNQGARSGYSDHLPIRVRLAFASRPSGP